MSTPTVGIEIQAFIDGLRERGFALRAQDGKLKVFHPTATLFNSDRVFIRDHRDEILDAVKPPHIYKEEPGDLTPADPANGNIPIDTPAPGTRGTPADPAVAWHSTIPRNAMRRIIEKEMATWTPERRQAQEEELQRIREYRRGRGLAVDPPAPSDRQPGQQSDRPSDRQPSQPPDQPPDLQSAEGFDHDTLAGDPDPNTPAAPASSTQDITARDARERE